jgi:hypothetical protein
MFEQLKADTRKPSIERPGWLERHREEVPPARDTLESIPAGPQAASVRGSVA